MVAKNKLPAVHGEIRVMEKLFFSQMELKPRGNSAVMSEIAQVHAPTALHTKRRKHSAGLQNNDAISIYIVSSIVLLLSSSVIFFSFVLNCLQDHSATTTKSGTTCWTS